MEKIFCPETTAKALILKIDIKNIFPPSLNEPESIFSLLQEKRKNKNVKRAPNGFIICRMNVHREAIKKKINCNMRIISKVTSILWKNANVNEKSIYLKIADEVKRYHEKSLYDNKQNAYDVFFLQQYNTSIAENNLENVFSSFIDNRYFESININNSEYFTNNSFHLDGSFMYNFD